jgi:hypothetical protein
VIVLRGDKLGIRVSEKKKGARKEAFYTWVSSLI